MKKILSLPCILFLLIMAVAACRRLVERPSVPEAPDRRRAAGFNATDYYWCEGNRIPIRRSESRAFVLFRALDNTVLSSLAKAGATITGAETWEFHIGGTDMSGEAARLFSGCKWAGVDIGPDAAAGIPELIYHAPYYSAEQGDEFAMTNMVYVRLKKAEDLALLERLAQENNVVIAGKSPIMPLWYVVACTKESKGDALATANSFYESGLFSDAEPAFISRRPDGPNDDYYPEQWNLENTGQYSGCVPGIDIGYGSAYNIMPDAGEVVVGVVDTGIELEHPDISIAPLSWDAPTASSPSWIRTYQDSPYHGTTCAGIIAAKTDNLMGVAGVAPCVKAMSISNCFGTPTTDLELAASIVWAVDHGASVISNSWGGGAPSATINSAINHALQNGRGGKGCVVVFSTGNSNSSTVNYPGSYTPDILAVGAISYNGSRKSPATPDGESWWGNNYGAALDVVAPGVMVPTTTLESAWTTSFAGTSAACSHVAAIAALILSVNPELTQRQVTDIVEQTAKKVGGYSYDTASDRPNGTWNSEMGYGLVDAFAALNAASCNVVYFDNRAVTSNTVVAGCEIYSENVAVGNNARLVINGTKKVEISWPFTVDSGAQLEISH
jgi:hypothetical protein